MTQMTQETTLEDYGVLTGKLALDSLEADLAAIKLEGLLTPRTDRGGLVRHIKAQVRGLDDQRGAILKEISPDNGQRVEQALDRLPRTGRALLYAQTRYKAAQLDALTREQADIQLILQWRKPMLTTLATLEALGQVSAERAAHIRAGSGHIDAARDAIELSALYVERWPAVELLQSLLQDASQRLDHALLSQIHDAALRFLGAANAEDDELPQEQRRREWEQKLTALQALLEQDWDALRAAAAYAYTLQGRPAQDFEPLASAYAIARRHA